MRLTGIRRGGAAWIAVEIDGALIPVAPVEVFYADVPAGLAQARTASREQGVEDAERVPPIPLTAKILCAGLNYHAHAAEASREVPPVPDIFGRWASTLVGPDVPVPVPAGEPGLDWEGELAAVVGCELRNATPQQVEAGILGYTCFNDLSARMHQRASKQWTVGKNADRSGPIGPAIVTRDVLRSPYGLRLRTRVDGTVMQDENTAQMIFSIGQIGSFASECMTLRPGDVIATGTPQGVGAARRPPIFLQPGQTVEVEIELIGVLRTPIIPALADAPAMGDLFGWTEETAVVR